MSLIGFHPTTIHLNLVKNPQCQAINKKYKFLTQCYKSKYFDLKISHTRVVRPERTGSGQTGPDHKVGPFSSLGPLQNVRGVPSNVRWQGPRQSQLSVFFIQWVAYQMHMLSWS